MFHSAVQAIGLILALQGSQSLQIPQPTGFINDFANVLDAQTERQLLDIATTVRARSGGDIAVVTLPDLKGRAEGDVALSILRDWGLGKKSNPGDPTRNTGVVILLVPKETSSDGYGHVFIATGYGAEGFITDAIAGRIRDEARPLLVERSYDAALVLMTTRVAERFAQEFNFSLDSVATGPLGGTQGTTRRGTGGGGFNFGTIVIIFLVIMFLMNALGGRRRRGGCGGG
ncbi:MAG TPA: TPM domain-containing protein, partial [Gemmatimonadaceae bacterium]|nr:TPM domain-containing protein [Gemmatimonadaceae bacterium]